MDQELKSAIMTRTSRRSYLQTPLAPAALASLQRSIREINAESGLNILFLEDGGAALAGGKSYGMFSGVRALLLLKGPGDLPHLREKVGYYGEQLVLKATGLGLGTCWVGGTFDRAALQIPDEEELICVIPIGNVREENTLKERLIRGVVHRKSKPIEALIAADRPLTDELRAAMELVQRAPTARNLQKVTFRLENNTITAHVPDDYPLDLVDLGICKLHLECGLGGRFAWGNGGSLNQTMA